MKTISSQEFQQKYGDQALQGFGQQPTQQPTQEPGYFQRIGQEVKNTAVGLGQDIQKQANVGAEAQTQGNYGQEALALARGGLRTVGAVAKTAFTPIMEAPGIKQATEAIGGALAKTTPIQKFQEWSQRHPEAAKDIMNTLDVGALFGGKEVAAPLEEGATAVAKIAGKAVGNVASKVAKSTALDTTKVAEYTAGRIPKLLGIFSGENNDVIKNALINPKVANIGIEQGDQALRTAVQEGASNSVKIKNTFVKAYAEAKQKVLGQYDKVVIPKNNVKGIFNDLLEKNGVKITPEGLDFSTSKIVANPGEIGKIKAAWDGLDNWGKFTLGSMDEYKQFVGKLRKFTEEGGMPSKSPFLGELYNNLNKIITDNPRVPKSIRSKYSELNKNFSNQIEMYDDIVDAFNSGDPFSKLANVLGKNKDTLRHTLEFYEKKSGKQVLPIVAGRELAMEKTAAFGFLNPRSWIDFLISPKAQGKAITKLGEKFPKITKRITQ